jgi:hypothetical protein
VLEDDCELDLLGLDRYDVIFFILNFILLYVFFRDMMDSNASNYLVVQTPADRQMFSHVNGGITTLKFRK